MGDDEVDALLAVDDADGPPPSMSTDETLAYVRGLMTKAGVAPRFYEQPAPPAPSMALRSARYVREAPDEYPLRDVPALPSAPASVPAPSIAPSMPPSTQPAPSGRRPSTGAPGSACPSPPTSRSTSAGHSTGGPTSSSSASPGSPGTCSTTNPDHPRERHAMTPLTTPTPHPSRPRRSSIPAWPSRPIAASFAPTAAASGSCSSASRRPTVAPDPSRRRPPVNLGFVLDRSGSMGSQRKLGLARQAVLEASHRLDDPDRFSVVVYDNEVEVVLSSALASRREQAPRGDPPRLGGRARIARTCTAAGSRAASRSRPGSSRTASTASCCSPTGSPTSASPITTSSCPPRTTSAGAG